MTHSKEKNDMKRNRCLIFAILVLTVCLASCGTPTNTEPSASHLAEATAPAQPSESVPEASGKPVTAELLCSADVWQDKNDVTHRLVFHEDGIGYEDKGIQGAPSFTWSLSKKGEIEIVFDYSSARIETDAVITEDGFMLVDNYSTKEYSFIPVSAKPADLPEGSCPEEYLGDWYQTSRRDGKQFEEYERNANPSIAFRADGIGNTYWGADVYMSFTWCIADDGRLYIKWQNGESFDLHWYESSVSDGKLTYFDCDSGVEKTFVR